MWADWLPLILFAAVFVVFLLRGGPGAVEAPAADRRRSPAKYSGGVAAGGGAQ